MGDSDKATAPTIFINDRAEALQAIHHEQKDLFNMIDNLKQIGLSNHVQLPQIIVVGGQSSGKSSVLEALSHVRFPVAGGLSTHFPIELILRNSHTSEIKVEIERKTENQPGRKIEPLAPPKTKDDIPAAIEKAKQLMGVKNGVKSYSTDVLRVSVCDPDVPNLTLVDLPGLYSNNNNEQSVEGIEIVLELARSYMRQKSSIILAIVSTTTDLIHHTVLKEARANDVDPSFRRTFGILTHPDRLEPGSTLEEKYVELVKGKSIDPQHRFNWHVLRNRSEADASCTAEERDRQEAAFFQTGVWRNVPSNRKGIESLGKRLSRMLFDHITQELPRLINRIEDALSIRLEELRQIGEQRSSPKEIRSYLIAISTEFEKIATNAVHGNYLDSSFFGGLLLEDETETRIEALYQRRLRARIRDVNRAFTIVMSEKGAKQSINWEDGIPMQPMYSAEVPQHLREFIDEHYADIPNSEVITESAFRTKAATFARQNQGCELPGEQNFTVALDLFKVHARPWRDIALVHIDTVTEMARDFVRELLAYVLKSDPDTERNINQHLVDARIEAQKKKLKEKLEELLPAGSKTGYSMPLEHEFEALSASRIAERLGTQLNKEYRPEKTMPPSEVFARNPAYIQGYLNWARGTGQQSSIEKSIDNMVALYQVSLFFFFPPCILFPLESSRKSNRLPRASSL